MIASLTFALAAAAPRAPAHPPLLGEKIALAAWRVADNRAGCAPLALVSNGGVPGSPRLADFSGGWGVAFDTPRTYSAYGFAGAGLLEGDTLSHAAQRKAISNWPYTREVGQTDKLPSGSFAGYGLEGGGRYSSANPRGLGQRSLAYLRIPGQSCLYNVWSKVSRAHLEKVLVSLRLIPGPLPPPPTDAEPHFAAWIARYRSPSTRMCDFDEKPPVPCRLKRDAAGALEVRTVAGNPMLVRVELDRVSVFAIRGGKRVRLFSDYAPHPGSMACLWGKEPPRAAHRICVD